jgi:hypothetical protein
MAKYIMKMCCKVTDKIYLASILRCEFKLFAGIGAENVKNFAIFAKNNYKQ